MPKSDRSPMPKAIYNYLYELRIFRPKESLMVFDQNCLRKWKDTFS